LSVPGQPGRDGTEEDSYTTGQVARVLRITNRGVRNMIDRGELEASQDERGRHLIPQRAVHALLEDRRASGRSPAEKSPARTPSGAPRRRARAAEEGRRGPAEGARASGGPPGTRRAHPPGGPVGITKDSVVMFAVVEES